MNCIVVDDEKPVIELMVDNIKQVPFLNLIGKFKNALDASECMHQQKADLIFLDIQMPGLNGLQWLETIEKLPLVVLVTAYKKYALDGFEVSAVDYLLKPFSFERFLKACNKAFTIFQLQQKTDTAKDPDHFFVYVEYNQVKIVIADILYIEAMRDYVKIFIQNSSRPVITKISLKAVEEKLSKHRFVRIHKSYVVNANRITTLKRDILCIGVFELPVSEGYKNEIKKLISS